MSIPPKWTLTYLGNVVDTKGGIQKTPDRNPIKNHHPYLRVANVYRNFLKLDEIKNFELFNNDLEKFRLKYGDVLIVEGNGSRNEIGRCALWRDEIMDCVHQNHIIRSRPNRGISSEFIVNYLNSPIGIEQLYFVSSSTSGLYTLSTEKINNIIIPIPPPKEQQIISNVVESQLTILKKNKEMINSNRKLLKNMKNSILLEGFQGKLIPQDLNDEDAEILLQKIMHEKQKIIKANPKLMRKKNDK